MVGPGWTAGCAGSSGRNISRPKEWLPVFAACQLLGRSVSLLSSSKIGLVLLILPFLHGGR